MRISLLAIIAAIFVSQVCQAKPKEHRVFLGSAAKTGVVVVRKNPTQPGGLSFGQADLTPAQAKKQAADTATVALLPNRPIPVPPTPAPRLSWDDLALTRPFSPRPTTWLAKDLCGASHAWASGYTGAGVKVAVMDEGIDFAHPDLQGCQARVTDPSSPYFGWPIVFDPSAMAMYAARGGGYTSTKSTITEQKPKYYGYTFTLPGTSKSGVYHIGNHPSYWLSYIMSPWGYTPAVLVADESVSGVYDTVYVDLNKNFDFRDDKPCRKGDEISWHDLDGDGLADLSGGMIYFIADGVNPIPASDWMHGMSAPANGTRVCFAGSFGKYDSHGTLVASAVAAKGVVGRTYRIPQKPGENEGMVYGMAPGAGIIQIGSIYGSYADLLNAIQFAIAGYDGVPGTGDEADVVNMSFSASSEDADGWDFLSRYITYLNETVAPRTTFVAASGNGGPGYGTVSSPGGSSSAVTVGASTLYGSTDAFGPIASAEQILFGDIQQWSNRGPSSLGQVKPDVAAIGAYATGDIPIYGEGEYSWATWGGTSLSAPITSGVIALVYEAYRSRYGQFPDHKTAKSILMSGAADMGYHPFEQGAGTIDAKRATDIASGSSGIVVSPSSWAAGNEHSAAYGFPCVMRAGSATTAEFKVTNSGSRPTSVTVESARLKRIGSRSVEVKTSIFSEDIEAVAERPDYLVDLTGLVPKGTDLLRVRVLFPYGKFSLSNPSVLNLRPASLWMLSLYDWADLNGDGSLWRDLNANGAVNEGEFESIEVNRFMTGSASCDCIEVSAREPLRRINDGLFLGLHHTAKTEDISATTLRIELEFYKRTDWEWLRAASRKYKLDPGASANIKAHLHVPGNATPGVYAGYLVLTDQTGVHTAVPVSTCVAADGRLARAKTSLVDGSDGLGDTFDNGRMFPAFDWGWREESGDWRFYFLDMPQDRQGTASFVLANAKWSDMPSDTDILLYKPERPDYFCELMPEVFGPYGLALTGSSRRTHSANGIWPFETATNGPSEWVAGRAEPGLNLIQLHKVLDSGKSGSEPVDLRAGRIRLEPSDIVLRPGDTSATLTLDSSMPLSGVSSLSFGFAKPEVQANLPISQEIIDEPEYSRWRRDLDVSNAGLIEISTEAPAGYDLDLYVLFDANSDGYFDWNYEVLASSGNPDGNERIRILLPKSGKYRVFVHGFKIPAATTFSIRTLVLTGNGIKTIIPAGTLKPGYPQVVSLSFPPAEAGSQGILFLGPKEAPGAIPVPIEVGD